MKEPPDDNVYCPIIRDKTKILSVISPGPKYLIMKRVGCDDSLSNVSPFLIKKVLDGTCGGELEMCKKLRNGTIMIKTKNYSQASKLIQLCSLNQEIKVEITEHKSLNSSRGVIYARDLFGTPEEEILNELRCKQVIKVEKIMKKTDNELKETGLIILTFNTSSPPTTIQVGYENARVNPYIPLPLKCKKCLRFGHHINNCNNAQLCTTCSKEQHTDPEENEICSLAASCINCIEHKKDTTNHSPNNKTCPIFIKEKEIQTIITLEKVSRKTAVKKYEDRHPNTPYASIIKTPVNITQTINKNNTSQGKQNEHTISQAPSTSKTSIASVRKIMDYSEITSENENSDQDVVSDTMDTSQPQNINKVTILPKNTGRILRKKIENNLKANNSKKSKITK